jgi:hypothetical protein
VSASLPLEGENEKNHDDEQRRKRRAEGARVDQTLHPAFTMQSEVTPVNFQKGEQAVATWRFRTCPDAEVRLSAGTSA